MRLLQRLRKWRRRQAQEIMPVTEFKAGMRRLAEAEPEHPWPRYAALRLAVAYANADDDAKRDCSRMLREDLAELDG